MFANRPQGPTTQRLGSPVPAVLLYCPPGAHAWKAVPRIPVAQRLGSLVPAAAAVVPGAHAPASRLQGSCCLQAWFPCACSSAIILSSQKPVPAMRPKNSHCCRLGSPMLAVAAVAPGTLHWQISPRAPATCRLRVPHACGSWCGSWKTTLQHR
jgi:hypothetical protein